MNAIGLFQATLYMYSTVKFFQKLFYHECSYAKCVTMEFVTLENKSHEWLLPFLGGRTTG